MYICTGMPNLSRIKLWMKLIYAKGSYGDIWYG